MKPPAAQSLDRATERGRVILRSFWTPEEIEPLRFGLAGERFARYRPLIPGKESLVRAAAEEETNVTLAVDREGTIVGAGILEHPGKETRWRRIGERALMEVSVMEVARPWRDEKLSKPLLRLLVDHPSREKRILFMVGYSWTWDLDGKGLTAMDYREMLIRLFSEQSFGTFQTNEPNVMLRPENLFMARIGESVPPALVKRFKRVRFGLDPDL